VDKLLHAHLNFEEALAIAEVGPGKKSYSAEDRRVLREVVMRAFSLQDERMREADPQSSVTMLWNFFDGLASRRTRRR
jgi:hypothetical protein